MALPHFHLTEIPEDGVSLTCEAQPDELALAPEDAQIVGSLTISLNIFMAGRRIDVSGTLKGTFRRQCVRCLKEYDHLLDVPFAAQYQCEPPAKRPGKLLAGDFRKASERDPERKESDPDEDVYPCTGDRLELGEMLREHVILATPIQPLCREGCPGLCAHCGQDLNEKVCGCLEENRKTPFAILRDIKARARDDKNRVRDSHAESET